MPVTLSDVRALLERALTRAENPAILRLPESERTVEGLARAYLPRNIWTRWACDGRLSRNLTGHVVRRLGHVTWCDLDLTDPGTCHAVLVALALALGLDPGVGGLDCSWCREAGEGYAWWLLRCAMAPEPEPDRVLFDAQSEADDDSLIGVRVVAAPTIANEPDPIKALCLAVRHLLDTP